MAETLPNGTVIPQGPDLINANGVQAMRNLGASVDTALAGKPSTAQMDAAVEAARWPRGILPTGSDINTLSTPGAHRVTASQPVENGPRGWEGMSYTLEVIPMGTSWVMQRATDRDGSTMFRIYSGSAWRRWQSDLADLTTGLEANGEWTSLANEIALLWSLGGNRRATYIEAGLSVEGRVIPALRIGFPEYPTVLLVGGQHGNEPGPREGLLKLARELLEAETLARFDISFLIVPNANPDGFAAWTRSNANGVNLNRDWADFTQPETRAIRSLITSHNVIAAIDGHNGGASRHINFTNPDNPTIAPEVMERGARLFDAVWEAVLDAEELPNRYPSTSEEGLFTVGLGSAYRIPAMVLEIPAIPLADRDDRLIPPYTWMQHATSVVVRSVIDTVWRERAAFIASKAGNPFTPPDRYRPPLELARSGVDGLSWADVTGKPETFPPAAHTHAVADVTGLAARLAALEYDSGWRDITGRIQEPVTGQILVKRERNTVWVDFRDFAPSAEATSSIVLSNVLPDGFKPPREMSLPLGPRVFDAANEIKGSVRVYLAGNLAFYRVAAGAVARGIGSFPAGQAPPTTLPGVPA